MGWIETIADRNNTQCQEKEDYNRVEGNTKYLLDLLHSLGYLKDVVQTNKTDWSISDIDSLQQHLRIINYINQIEFISLPGLKHLRLDLDIIPPNYQDYNDWEHNLEIICKYVKGTLGGLKRLSFNLGGDKFGA